MTSKRPGPIECVIYDVDGVLFDSLEANRMLYNKIVESMGRPPLTPEQLSYCHTHTVYESITFLFRPDLELEKQALEVLRDKVDFKDFIVYLKMEPNLMETLAALRERKIKTAICTNRTTSMKYVMDRFGLWPYFDTVVTALDVKHPKPHPGSAEKILETLQADGERTLFLGDSEVDRETALSAGVKFIAYKNEAIAVDGLINDHLDLLRFLSAD